MPMRGTPRHKDTHESGGSDEIDSPLNIAAIPDCVPRNLAYGITPTVVGTWTTEPDNLDNATDGDQNTATGTGVTNDTTIEVNRVQVDLGQPCFLTNALFSVGIWTDNATYAATMRPMISKDGTTWFDCTGNFSASTKSLTEVRFDLRISSWDANNYGLIRYIGASLHSGDATANAYMKVYELAGVGILL